VRRMADQLREEFQRARISEAVEAGQVEVLDYAAVPLEPVGSRRSLKLALGLVLGVMLGGGGAFLLENLNTSIRRREDLEETLQLPSLAMIPQIRPGKKRGAKTALPAGAGGNGGNGKGAAVVANGAEAPALVTISDVRSSGSEAFRSLRTNLLFSDSARGLKTLLVTSTGPSEGKTTTAANLAVTYAQQGMRVLVIDCDLRKPRLHAAFGTGREPGLTQLVLGYATAEEVVRETPVENLFIIPAGTIPPNPTELLGGARMRETLAAVAEGYNMVILDTSPTSAGADAAILGAACDGVLMVIRAGKTDRDAARHALGQLGTVGARVLGGVLNDPDAELPKYGGYYGYYEYYGEEAGK
jgi:polysaccharide biosynthesis transport protein